MGCRFGALEDLARLKKRPLILFGAGGRLGRAVADAAARRGIRVDTIRWTETRAWIRTERWTEIQRAVASYTGVDILFASGLTDPQAPAEDLMLGNVEIPTRVIDATASDPRYRYITIGSVLENFAKLAAHNRYLASKAALSARIQAFKDDLRLKGRIVHLRLHTLYGGPPAPHSFLGQIYESLLTQRPFLMSAGRQLREYSYVADVASSIMALQARNWQKSMVFDLSTGQPVTLRQLALAVFRAFNCEELLRIGALPTPEGENDAVYFTPSPAWLLGKPRDPVEGIIEWLSALLGRRRGG